MGRGWPKRELLTESMLVDLTECPPPLRTIAEPTLGSAERNGRWRPPPDLCRTLGVLLAMQGAARLGLPNFRVETRRCPEPTRRR